MVLTFLYSYRLQLIILCVCVFYYKIIRIDEDVRQRRNGCRDPMALLSTPPIHCNLLFNWKKFRLSRGQITTIDYHVFSVVFYYIHSSFLFLSYLFRYIYFFLPISFHAVSAYARILFIYIYTYLFVRMCVCVCACMCVYILCFICSKEFYHRLPSTVINLFIFVLYRSTGPRRLRPVRKINGNNLVCLSATTLIHPE